MPRATSETILIDRIIGKKIESLRLAAGLSAAQLAEKIGITHQQLHKYEKAINRISVSKLYIIARALHKPTSFFFDDIDGAKESDVVNTNRTRICIELVRNFGQLQNIHTQNSINALVRTLLTSEKVRP